MFWVPFPPANSPSWTTTCVGGSDANLGERRAENSVIARKLRYREKEQARNERLRQTQSMANEGL